jgi:3-phosphoshikimate 1-carboxyvinyltransferase
VTDHLLIIPAGPLDAEIEAPPSKSLTIRALAAAALARGRSALRRPLLADDTRLMARALTEMGIDVARRGSSVIVEGKGRPVKAPPLALNLGNAGTPLRLLTGICCLGKGRFVLDGSERMRRRPLTHLIEALQSLGVAIQSVNQEGHPGCPPVAIEAGGFAGGRVRLKGDLSSQFVSSLLMIGPCGASDLEIEIEGDLVSWPYVDLTLQVMESFGARVRRDGYRWFQVDSRASYQPHVFPVEGDASSASYFFAAAAIAGGRARVTGIPSASKQGDLRFLDFLEAMGCRVGRGEAGIDVEWRPGAGAELAGIDADLSDCPDVAPTLAAVALFANGPTTIRNVGHLRIKESDRIDSIAACVRTLGGEAQTGPDSLIVRPPSQGRRGLHGGDIDPKEDHRLAMAFALAGLSIPGVRILDPSCVSKSFPGFFDQLRELCGE